MVVLLVVVGCFWWWLHSADDGGGGVEVVVVAVTTVVRVIESDSFRISIPKCIPVRVVGVMVVVVVVFGL